jgi:hypothetical protein
MTDDAGDRRKPIVAVCTGKQAKTDQAPARTAGIQTGRPMAFNASLTRRGG